jgi:cytochrome c-type biogenesis protein CcmH/NrfG
VLSARSIRELRDFARTHREDPRPHLVLAQSYMNDGAVTSAIERYELAYSFDGSARGDQRMLGDLVKLAESESVGDRAADLLVDAYGGDALEAVTRALSRSRLNARARRRLEALRERLDQE